MSALLMRASFDRGAILLNADAVAVI